MIRASLLKTVLGLLVAGAAWTAQPGTVFLLSAPSGTGKSTLAKKLVREVPGLVVAVSHTTRAPRPGEREGVDYFFVDDARFDAMLAQGRFQESVEIYGRRYGLSREWLEKQLAAGQDVLLDLATGPARTLRQTVPGTVSVFLLPPSAGELGRRLRRRATETGQQVALRLGQARHECSRYPEYDYLVVNDTVEQAFRELQAIVLATRARQARRCGQAQAILEGFPPD